MSEGSAHAASAGRRYSFVGEATPAEAWDALQSDAKTALLDVRTDAEWAFVGAPDLSALSKSVWLLPWKTFPTMGRNPSFFEALEQKLAETGATTVFVICRSGARSREAAIAAAETFEAKRAAQAPAGASEEDATDLGGVAFVNVEEGFEGNLDGERHRGRLNGWKARGLPWAQS